ncbi:MAG: DUF4339 domain-containing protein [Candidatus Cloacimonadota bacterium]|nr:MAG: DUF4339 domain-containing protein [Candidatus Cloacimonadota bacterium]
MANKVEVKKGEVVIGEFSMEEIIEKLANGLISCYDKIYYAKNDEWIEISKIKNIADYVSDKFHWKYEKGEEIHGPFAKDDLILFIKDGKVSVTDKVYHPCLKEWKKVEEVDEFKQWTKEAGEEKKSELSLDNALKSVDYKVCPKCGMQNLKSADSCNGCDYAFTEVSEEQGSPEA